MRSPAVLLALLLPQLAAAQGATAVPKAHVPPSVVMELRALESQFDLALSADCAAERCFSKGCVYRDHVTVDMPRASSLPGLGQDPGPGSVPAQEYLTQARCEFAHEKSVPIKDVQALVRRLEQRLSKGWLHVTVGRQILAPISEELRQPPPPEPPPAPEKVESVAPTPEVPAAPPEWKAGVALRELWLSLLPHFSWMVAVVLGTLSALLLIWAMRRLGRESLEEKAMLAQLTADAAGKGKEEAPAPAVPAAPESPLPGAGGEEGGFVIAQRQLWADRIAQAELARDESGVVELLRGWLKAGEFELLAKAIFVFGDRLSLAFPSDGELAVRKVEFAEFLRSLDEKGLPSDEEFFRKLNHHAISSSLLSQADAELYRSLREEFGSTGVARLVEGLPPRPGALLFGLASTESQHEVARTMSTDLRLQVADQLLVSNRISPEETRAIFEVLAAARAGQPLPAWTEPGGLVDRGREFDAAGALSVLLPLVEPADRQALFAKALERAGGVFPSWYENILYGDMLLKVPSELQKDMLLELDVKSLAGWSSVQQPAWQEDFLARMGASMQSAVRANMAFTSRAEQLRQARRGHSELVAAMKRQVAQGRLSFPEIIA